MHQSVDWNFNGWTGRPCSQWVTVDVRFWHLADIECERTNVRIASQSGTADYRLPIADCHFRRHTVTGKEAE